MTTFDESAHPRDTSSGRFAATENSGPEVTLSADWDAILRALPPSSSRPAVDSRVDREDVAPSLAAFDEHVDMFVDSIIEGHLSRGVAGRDRVAAAQAWVDLAATVDEEEAQDFRDGALRAAVAFYNEKLDYEGPVAMLTGEELDRAGQESLAVALTKRASKQERETWRWMLPRATPAEHRGMFVMAAALSGTDSWWGFRDHASQVVTGS